MTHEYRIRVRNFHCDTYGHVNNARYLEFLEEARWDFTEHTRGLDALPDRGLGLVVAAVNIEFRRPLLREETAVIRSRMASYEGRRAVMRQEVARASDGKTAAVADITFAIIEMASGRAIELDEGIRALFVSGRTAEPGA